MSLVVFAPLRLEALALRRGLSPASEVVRTGMGPVRARAAAEELATDCYKGRGVVAVAVAGVCGGVRQGLRAGDIVVATAVRTEHGDEQTLPGSSVLATALRTLGLTCVTGTILSVERLARDARTAARGHGDVVAVDMESAWLARSAKDRPVAVLRVVADTAGRPIYHPRTAIDGARALAVLRRAAPALEEWAGATGPHTGLDPARLAGTRTIGLTTGVSAPAADESMQSQPQEVR